MPRSIRPLIMTALALFPIGGAWGAHLSVPAYAATVKTVKGPVVDTRFGPVQVVLKVQGKKITSVKIVNNPDTRRSVFIQQQAVPILKQETLQTQTAAIDLVSGATMTSEAYIQSLQSALKKAHLPLS